MDQKIVPTNAAPTVGLIFLQILIFFVIACGIVSILIRFCCGTPRRNTVHAHRQTTVTHQLSHLPLSSTQQQVKKTLKQALSSAEFDQFIPKYTYDRSINKYHSSACVICLEEFTVESIVRETPICNHIFHAKCIEAWLDKDERCPDCRQEITVTEYEKWKQSANQKKLVQADKNPSISTLDTLYIRSRNLSHEEIDHTEQRPAIISHAITIQEIP